MWKGFLKNSKSTLKKVQIEKKKHTFFSSWVLDYPCKNSEGLLESVTSNRNDV